MAVFVDDTAAVRMLLANGADVEAVFGVWVSSSLLLCLHSDTPSKGMSLIMSVSLVIVAGCYTAPV